MTAGFIFKDQLVSMINFPLNDNENFQSNKSLLVRKTLFKATDTGLIISIVDIRNLLLYKRSLFIWQHTEVCFASFLSGGSITIYYWMSLRLNTEQIRRLSLRTFVLAPLNFAHIVTLKKK